MLRASCAVLAVAVVMLGVFAGSAGASRSINFSPTGSNFASGILDFSSPEIEFFIIRCVVRFTFEGVRGGAKETGTVVANITNVGAISCEEGEVRPLSPQIGSPWRVTYQFYFGTLPNITTVGLEMRGIAMLISTFAVHCLYGGNLQVRTVGNPATSIEFSSTSNVPLLRDLGGLIACPRQGNLQGSVRFERSLRMTLA